MSTFCVYQCVSFCFSPFYNTITKSTEKIFSYYFERCVFTVFTKHKKGQKKKFNYATSSARGTLSPSQSTLGSY